MNRIAIIPARGGSKRIPGKNIRNFLGKPIIAYSIEAARGCGLFDEIMVSTDSREIADVAISYGASVPFYRSRENSDDYAPLASVLLEVLTQYRQQNKEWENICCILPTAPFVRSHDLLNAWSIMEKTGANGIVSVCRFSYPVQRALKIKEDRIFMAEPEYAFTRSQDLESMYHDAGQFYFINGKTLEEEKTLFCSSVAGFEIEELRVQDIDSESDWKLAEIKYSFLSQ
jgi:N-acylneuraminate cytidylyltransferase